jgi:hypothetical protein
VSPILEETWHRSLVMAQVSSSVHESLAETDYTLHIGVQMQKFQMTSAVVNSLMESAPLLGAAGLPEMTTDDGDRLARISSAICGRVSLIGNILTLTHESAGYLGYTQDYLSLASLFDIALPDDAIRLRGILRAC